MVFNNQMQVQLNTAQDICLVGRIDLNNVVDTCDKVTTLLHNMRDAKIDLSAIESADSSSLILFVECMRYAKQNHIGITFCNVPGFIVDLSRVCGLDNILPINQPLVFH